MGLAMLAAVDSAAIKSNHKKPTHSHPPPWFNRTPLLSLSLQNHKKYPNHTVTPNKYLVLVATTYVFQATKQTA